MDSDNVYNGVQGIPLFNVNDLSSDSILVVIKKPLKVLEQVKGEVPVLKPLDVEDVLMVQLVSASEIVL